MVKVTFLPLEKTIEVPKGTGILEAAISAGVGIESTCGGRGTCGKCTVLIKPLHLQEVTFERVLACKSKIHEDTLIMIEEKKEVSQRKIGLNTNEKFRLNSGINKYHLVVPEPSIENPCPDWERLCSQLPFNDIGFNHKVAATLPQVLRLNNHEVTVVMENKSILAVEPGNTGHRSYGIAVDLGTTTVVAHLMDLNKGTVVASRATTNPQNIFGADVISRITYANKGPVQLKELQQRVIEGLNKLILELCDEYLIKPEEIYKGVVVGNTTMAHLFLGLDPSGLATAPFTPVFQQEVEVEAGELGLSMLNTGKVVVLSNIAGYVGSDTVGVMLAAGVDNLKGINLIIDIGTNGEIVLVGNGKMFTCSTAAGPAFEGAEIKYGMRATEGAIEGVQIADDVRLDIIGNLKAQGICGSGLIDAIAEMVRVGIVEPSGRFHSQDSLLGKLPSRVIERVRINDGVAEFVLAWADDTTIGEDIVITQKDIRELQLAKGAIVAGTKILLQKMGIQVEDLDKIMLAGAFGNYIKKESALAMGLLPPIELKKIKPIGNAAGQGAKMVLLSIEERERAIAMAGNAQHIELSVQKDFQNLFIQSFSLGTRF